jgi:hypothetical protein
LWFETEQSAADFQLWASGLDLPFGVLVSDFELCRLALCTTILAALHWQYPQATPWVLAALAVLSAYTVWAYRPQLRQVGRAWAWMLPGLRVAAMATVAASLVRPAVTRPRAAGERGPIVVMVDDSASMAVTDTGRLPGERVAVAAALGRLPVGTRDGAAAAVASDAARLSALTDDVAVARSAVGYARLAGRDTDAATARLDRAVAAVRAAARAAAADNAGLVSTPSLDRALAYLSAVPAGNDPEAWLDRIGDRARAAAAEAERARAAADARLYDDDPTVHDAADATAGQTRERLAWAAVFDPTAGLLARLGPGASTVAYTLGDRVAPVAPAAPRPRPDGNASDLAGGVRAVLERMAATAGPADEPPRAVVLLSDGRQVDGEPPEAVAAAAAGVPVDTVFVAAREPSPNLSIADLSVPPAVYPGEPAVCRATVRANGFAARPTNVTFRCGDEVQVRRVVLEDRPQQTVAFSWVPRGAGPMVASVSVAPLAGESTTADNAQERWTRVVAASLRVTAVAGADGWAFEAACQSLARTAGVQLCAGDASAGDPSVTQLAASDVVLLFGVTAKSLSVPQWEAVTQLVENRGGGVVFVAGDGGFGPGVPAASPLARLLPIAGSPPPWTDRPDTRLRAAVDAPRFDVPPIDGFLPLTPLRPDARPWLLAGDGDAAVAVLAERHIGAGRSLCLGTDQTWRWRLRPGGGEAHDRFWATLARAAAGAPYAIEQAGIALDADAFAIVPRQSDRVRMRAEGPTPPRTLRVIGSGGAVVRSVPFTARGGGRFEAALGGLSAGTYTLGVDGGPRLPLRVRPSYEAELADVTGDDGFLHRLSAATGGQSFRLDQLELLAARLAAPPAEPARPVELTLWDGPYLMAIVVGLLTAEWGLRKQAGLA